MSRSSPRSKRLAPRVRPGPAAAAVLLVGGLLAMLIGGGALLATWYAGRSWAATDEAERASRQLAADAPQWIDGPTTPAESPRIEEARSAADVAPSDPARRSPTVTPEAAAEGPSAVSWAGTTGSALAAAAPTVETAAAPADEPAAAPIGSSPALRPTPERRAPADAIELVDSDFHFVDPPEPGARARITVTVRNRSDFPSGPLQLVVSTTWLEGWKVIEADPPVLDDREQPEKRRVFVYPGLAANVQRTLVLGLVATDDAVDPPDLSLALEDGPEIGQARPKTVAPRPRPGPARTIEIPRLNLRAAVVPVVWEPPAWVVGQIRTSANLSEGNTVLIGHLNGLIGNVFGDLDRLRPGDEIVATSRGLDYHFVVSEMIVLPGSQSLPMEPADEPRLTLMTCSGSWDPLRRDYSHRLWVIAEPRELAQTALAGGPGPLERQFGLTVASTPEPTPTEEATALPSEDPIASTTEEPAAEPQANGASPTDATPEAGAEQAVVEPQPAPTPVVPPSVIIAQPADGTAVGPRALVRGIRTGQANPKASLWLVVRADVEGSHWYLYRDPLAIKPDGTWEAQLELGGGPGIRHTILVAPVDPSTDGRLRRFAAEHPGEPLPDLPDAFDGAAHVRVSRR